MLERLTSITGLHLDSIAGRRKLEQHYASLLEHVESDFRCASLNRLVMGFVTPGRVLDIGCGSGGLSVELLRRGYDVMSQDPSEEMIAMCRCYLARHHFCDENVRLGGVEDIPEVEEFDTVIALDVLEHIEDDRRALESMRRCLKRSGRLIISVPAISCLYGLKDTELGHYRRYDKRELMALLEEGGFATERVRFWNAIGVLPVWFSVKVLKKRLNEDFRYAGRSSLKRALNTALLLWFDNVENLVPAPFGLTLIATAKPKPRCSTPLYCFAAAVSSLTSSPLHDSIRR